MDEVECGFPECEWSADFRASGVGIDVAPVYACLTHVGVMLRMASSFHLAVRGPSAPWAWSLVDLLDHPE